MKKIILVLWFFSFCGYPFAVSATTQPRIPAIPEKESSWFVNLNRFADSAHGTFSCEQCHADMDKGDKVHPVSESSTSLTKNATRLYDYSRCKTCHRKSYENYILGAHARALQKEKAKPDNQHLSGAGPGNAPTCGDCHSAHYARSHLSRLETGRNATEVCGSCHLAQKASYLENYHGKAAVNLGNERSAFCTDCHGAHDCVSLKDKEAALTACRRCHPEAGQGFVEFVIHVTPKEVAIDAKQKRERVALIRVITAIMAILAVLVVGFFYGHTFLWILRELHERLRRHH